MAGSARFASTSPDGRHIDQWPPKDFDAFARRMVLLAKRYPFVRYWQIWNEPNIPSFWRPRADPQAYARLVDTVVRAFRAAGLDDRELVLGGMAYYSQMPNHGNALMLEALGSSPARASSTPACAAPGWGGSGPPNSAGPPTAGPRPSRATSTNPPKGNTSFAAWSCP